MTKVLLFVDMEFPRVRGAKVEKSWKFQEEGGYYKAPWNRKSWGVGGQIRRNPPWGVWIFYGTTHLLFCITFAQYCKYQVSFSTLLIIIWET